MDAIQIVDCSNRLSNGFNYLSLIRTSDVPLQICEETVLHYEAANGNAQDCTKVSPEAESACHNRLIRVTTDSEH
jgi:hypothetical protein